MRLALTPRDRRRIAGFIARMFRLDDDLSPFYRRIADDENLSWAAAGAGRLLSSPTVFEDVVKTICTTNCAWSATIRMTTALVARGGGAFPEPQLLAATPDAWYRDVARMGYRGPYVKSIARDVAAGALDLESLLPARERGDEDVEKALLGAARHRPVRCGARHAAAGTPSPPGSRLVDAAYVFAFGEEEARGRRIDSARVRALWRACRSRVLAVPHPRLGGAGKMNAAARIAEPTGQAVSRR